MTHTAPPFRDTPESRWLAHKTKPVKILFLDDDANLCRMMEIVCSCYHTKLTVTHTIKDAVRIVNDCMETNPFDVLILDVRVSNGTGMDLYAHVMSRWPRTKVIFLTGWDTPEVRARVEAIGPARIHRKDSVMRPMFMQALFATWGVKQTAPLE